MIQEYLRVPASTLIEAANQTIYMVAVSLVARYADCYCFGYDT